MALWNICGLLLFQILGISSTDPQCPLKRNPFKKTQLSNKLFDSYMMLTNGTTLTDCVTLCDETSICISFGFNYIKNICYTYDTRPLYSDLFVFDDGLVNYWMVEEVCPVGYNNVPEVGLCYKVVNTPLNHSNAEKFCEAEGGHLIILDTPEKRNYMSSTHGNSLSFFGAGGCTEYNGDGWAWFNGAPITVWREGQPDNWTNNFDANDPGEKCLNLWYNNDLLNSLGRHKGIAVNDYRCAHVRGFVCEIPVAS